MKVVALSTIQGLCRSHTRYREKGPGRRHRRTRRYSWVTPLAPRPRLDTRGLQCRQKCLASWRGPKTTPTGEVASRRRTGDRLGRNKGYGDGDCRETTGESRVPLHPTGEDGDPGPHRGRPLCPGSAGGLSGRRGVPAPVGDLDVRDLGPRVGPVGAVVLGRVVVGRGSLVGVPPGASGPRGPESRDRPVTLHPDSPGS